MTDTDNEDLCRLYLITPPRFVLTDFVETAREAFEAGDIAAFQLRMKDASDDEIMRAASLLMPLAHAYDAAFILNDRPDLAKKIGADGVHIGAEDGSVAEARTLVGHDATIGVSCYDSMDLAFEAGEAGADYIAFGAFFPTTTKETTAQADLDLITRWVDMAELPVVAIGGITPENAEPIVKAGAHFVAVSSGVWNHPEGPAAAVKAFNTLFEAASPK